MKTIGYILIIIIAVLIIPMSLKLVGINFLSLPPEIQDLFGPFIELYVYAILYVFILNEFIYSKIKFLIIFIIFMITILMGSIPLLIILDNFSLLKIGSFIAGYGLISIYLINTFNVFYLIHYTLNLNNSYLIYNNDKYELIEGTSFRSLIFKNIKNLRILSIPFKTFISEAHEIEIKPLKQEEDK